MNKNKVIVILGPTSSGKSDIAIKLAKKFKGEIISADSRQIYRGMDIGTGKIPSDNKTLKKSFDLEELRATASKGKVEPWMSHGIPHYMISIVSPRTDFNVAKFKQRAEKIIADILRRGKLPIVCGGTGFWIQALVDNLNFPEVKPDWKLRRRLEKYTPEKLFSLLKRLDPARAKTIDAKNKVRLIRAIEICKAIGKVPTLRNSQLVIRNPDKKNPNYQLPITNYTFLQIGIKLPKEKLYQNIKKRVLDRFAQGMIEEVENLHRAGLSWKKIQSFGLAYYWIPLYLQKKLGNDESKSLALVREKVIQAEKNYAKRQMTWFKRDKRIHWLKNYREIEKRVRKFLNK